MSDTVNPFERALEILGPSGDHWIKGKKQTVQGVCLGRALCLASFTTNRFEETVRLLAGVIEQRYPRRCRAARARSAVVEFNDHPDTGWEDIALVGKEAAREWQARNHSGSSSR
jgi:hypothetical protein